MINKLNRRVRCNVVGALVIAIVLTVSSALLRADVQVNATVTPLGGSFLYEILVTNNEAVDLAIVSLDAPMADPLISPSLTGPAGFLTSYDGGLGFVDLLSNADTFPAMGSAGLFSFESLAAPGAGFGAFSALDVAGGPYTGTVQFEVVPEASTMAAALGLFALGAFEVCRRRKVR